MIPVYVVILEGVMLLDLSGIAEPLRLANEWAVSQRRPRPFDLRFVGPEPSARSSLGVAVAGVEPLPEALPPSSWLVVPGTGRSRRDYQTETARKLVRWLAQVGEQAERRLTVCSGALLAGRAGWLAGRECTSHHELIDALREAAPGAKVLGNRIFVVDGGVATSAGITAGIDLALWAIGEVLGPAGALAVAREMVVFARRAGADPQLSAWLANRNHVHPAVHRIQDAIAHAPAEDWPLPRMAKVAHVGARHLTRLFAEHAGVTPLIYLQRIRLDVARALLDGSESSVDTVAAASGFSSAHQLRRAWRRELGGTPRRSVTPSAPGSRARMRP